MSDKPEQQLPPPLRGIPVTQIAMVVPDLEASVATWSATLGHEGWPIYAFGPENVPFLRYRGDPATFTMRVALSSGSPQIELIEPGDGPSIYHDFIDAHGYGVHHLGFHVADSGTVIRNMRSAGYAPVQEGAGYAPDGGGSFFYFDLTATLGLYLEVITVPEGRRPGESP
ncbi:MAG TPA: VOC family protein [Streptosporangiaceae bacterium]